jgi:hypothetical protein
MVFYGVVWNTTLESINEFPDTIKRRLGGGWGLPGIRTVITGKNRSIVFIQTVRGVNEIQYVPVACLPNTGSKNRLLPQLPLHDHRLGLRGKVSKEFYRWYLVSSTYGLSTRTILVV